MSQIPNKQTQPTPPKDKYEEKVPADQRPNRPQNEPIEQDRSREDKGQRR